MKKAIAIIITSIVLTLSIMSSIPSTESEYNIVVDNYTTFVEFMLVSIQEMK